MAKRRSKRERKAQRDSNYITTVSAAPTILSLEDRRMFHPEDVPHPRGSLNRSSRLVVSVAPKARHISSGLPAHIKFNVPKEVALCVRRKQRRQVLFALRRTGKGARKFYRRRNEWSNVRC